MTNCVCVSAQSECYFYYLYVSGLVFDESQPADPTLQLAKEKPKVALVEDPKQAQVYIITIYVWVIDSEVWLIFQVYIWVYRPWSMTSISSLYLSS